MYPQLPPSPRARALTAQSVIDVDDLLNISARNKRRKSNPITVTDEEDLMSESDHHQAEDESNKSNQSTITDEEDLMLDLLNASAQDTSSKSNQITSTDEQDLLSESEESLAESLGWRRLECKNMEAEDHLNRTKIEAKSALELYCCTVRGFLALIGKQNRDTVEKALGATSDLLHQNHFAEQDEFEAKQQELQSMVNRMIYGNTLRKNQLAKGDEFEAKQTEQGNGPPPQTGRAAPGGAAGGGGHDFRERAAPGGAAGGGGHGF